MRGDVAGLFFFWGGGGEKGREWHQWTGLMMLAAITCISTARSYTMSVFHLQYSEI